MVTKKDSVAKTEAKRLINAKTNKREQVAKLQLKLVKTTIELGYDLNDLTRDIHILWEKMGGPEC